MSRPLNSKALPFSLKPSEAGRWEPSEVLQVLLAALALIFLAPLLLLITLAVKLTSPGPALYRGARVGKGGRVFTIYKFRTLEVGAEQKIGARLLSEKDACYTPLGRFLKKTKLDELPQLWNVLKGDMNLVGPRPVRPIFLERFSSEIPRYRERFQVKPGMTGLAQVRGGYFTRPRDKLRYELLYLRHRSLLLDLKIMGLTLLKLFHRWLSLGFLLFALFLFVSFIPASFLYLSLGGIRFNAIHALMVAFGVYLLGRHLPQNRLSLYRSPLYLPMGLFLLCSLVSVFFSPDPVQALRGAAYYGVTGFLIALGIINSRITRRFVRRAVDVAALTAAIVSGLGLLRLVVVDYLASAEASLRVGPELLYPDRGIAATLGSPQALASYLTLAAPYLLCRLSQARERKERDLWVAAATLAFIGVLLTKAFWGLCALVLTASLYMFRYFRPRTLGFFLLALSPFLVLSLLNTSPLEALGVLAVRGWQGLLAPPSLPHLLFGHGARTLKGSWFEVEGAIPAPENAYFSLFWESGLVGTLAMLWVMVAVLVSLYRAWREVADEELRRTLWATFCSTAGFLVALFAFNAFSHWARPVFWWGGVGVGMGATLHLSGKPKRFLLDLKLGH